MTITYSKYYAKFTIPTSLTAEPIIISLRKRKSQVEAAQALLDDEFNRLEREIAAEEIDSRAIRDELTRRVRSSFKHIFKGDVLVRKTTVLTRKTATRLNERGENDYRVVSQDSIDRYEWKKTK